MVDVGSLKIDVKKTDGSELKRDDTYWTTWIASSKAK
jgi:hypothetical protein